MVSRGIHPEDPAGMFEFACHESNYGVFNVVKGAQTREKNWSSRDCRSPRRRRRRAQ